jgi:hypothetical protein
MADPHFLDRREKRIEDFVAPLGHSGEVETVGRTQGSCAIRSRIAAIVPLERSCRQSLWWDFPKAVSHTIERINHVEGIVDCYEFLA